MYEDRFTVAGKGHFPTDMLRRDECYPADEESAANIAHATVNTSQYFRKPRMVRLIHRGTVKFWRPNEKRWYSFGWAAAFQEENEK